MRRRALQRGSVMVEVALVATLFFALVFGVISIAYLVYAYNSVGFMAQQGARWASVRGNTSGSPTTPAAVKTYVLTQGTGLATTALNVTTTFTPDQNPGSTVKVVVTYSATPLVSTFLPGTLNLTGSSAVAITR
jgi:Flp pilus assembly protein TadG